MHRRYYCVEKNKDLEAKSAGILQSLMVNPDGLLMCQKLEKNSALRQKLILLKV